MLNHLAVARLIETFVPFHPNLWVALFVQNSKDDDAQVGIIHYKINFVGKLFDKSEAPVFIQETLSFRELLN